jgi:hypothetical protein
MPIPFDCPHCKTRYEVADDLAGKWIMCRGCQKRGPVRSPAAAGASVAVAKPSRRQAIRIVAWTLASLGSIGAGALLARRPWRHWRSSAETASEDSPDRRGRRRGGPPGGPPEPPPAP